MGARCVLIYHVTYLESVTTSYFSVAGQQPDVYPATRRVQQLLPVGVVHITYALPIKCLRPYHVESASSRPITEAKQR